MIDMTVYPNVIDEWKDALYRFAHYRNDLYDVLRWFGETAVETMKSGHPPGGPHPPDGEMPAYGENAYIDRSGWLTDSIAYTLEPFQTWSPSDGSASALPTLTIVATAPYADAIEFGVPGRARPYPFFWPTITVLLPEAMSRLADVMERINAVKGL